MQSAEKTTHPDDQIPWQEEEIHLSDYLNVLRRRKALFFAVFGIVFVLVALYTFLVTPIYQASATLHVRDEKGKVDLLGDLGFGQGSPIESEIEILKSRTNAEDVVRRLHLDWKVDKESPELSVQVGEFSSNSEEPVYLVKLTAEGRFDVLDSEDQLVGQGRSGELLQGEGIELLLTDLQGKKGDSFRLTLKSFNGTVRELRQQISASQKGKQTNIFGVTYPSSDPVEARDVVNTLVAVFLERSVTVKTQEASKSLEFIAGQMENVRLDLDTAEKQLESFKRNAGLVQLDTEAESFIEQLANTEAQLAALNVRKIQLDFAREALADALFEGENYTPSVMVDDPVVAGLAQKLIEYNVEKKALLVEYTPEHPVLKALSQQVAEIQGRADGFAGEFFAQQAGHPGEGVKRSLGPEAADAGYLVQRLDDVAPTLIEGRQHGGDTVLGTVVGGDGRLLTDGSGVGSALALDFGHGCHQRRRAGGEADPPAGHGVAFRDPVENDGPFLDGRSQLGDAALPEAVVDDVFVNFIGDQQQVVVGCRGSQGLQLVPGVGGPGGVGGRVDDHRLRLFAQVLAQLLGGDFETLLLGGGDDHRHAAGQLDHRRVGNPVGRRNDHLVAGVEQGLGQVVEGVLAATGDDDLLVFVLQLVFPDQLGPDRFFKFRNAGHRRVAGEAVLDGLDGGGLDVFRGVEIRLAGAEIDDIDAGGLHGLGLGGNGQGGRGFDLLYSGCQSGHDFLLAFWGIEN